MAQAHDICQTAKKNPTLRRRLEKRASKRPTDPGELAILREFRWLVEEYKASIFAQELGAKKPVSPPAASISFLKRNAAYEQISAKSSE